MLILCQLGRDRGCRLRSLQMVTNSGDDEGLFRGAVMLSGSPFPNGDITHVQNYYDIVVEQTGYKHSTDTLDCVRHVPADTLLAAAATLPNLFDYTVCPRLRLLEMLHTN